MVNRTEQERLDNIVRMFEALSTDTSAPGVRYLNERKSIVVGYFVKTQQWHMLMGILQYLQIPDGNLTLKERVAFFKLGIDQE